MFRFEIEQMIDKKLQNIEKKKKMSFKYNKPLHKIHEEEEEHQDEEYEDKYNWDMNSYEAEQINERSRKIKQKVEFDEGHDELDMNRAKLS